ncbi:hypothetical protein ABN238_11960 [Providencia rettgeri]|uniref:hypothetical protein n=1 Tax=Providencia rettgeri TaxID=587 RepID=UPI0032DA01F3
MEKIILFLIKAIILLGILALITICVSYILYFFLILTTHGEIIANRMILCLSVLLYVYCRFNPTSTKFTIIDFISLSIIFLSSASLFKNSFHVLIFIYTFFLVMIIASLLLRYLGLLDKTKEKVDLYRSELEKKEIEAMMLDVKKACYFHEIADVRICAERLYKAGYRKVE